MGATGACIVNLINTTIIHKDELRLKGDTILQDSIIIQPLRGDILACDGSILATNLNYYNVRIDFRASRINELNYLESLDSLADTLAHYYPIRDGQEWREYLRKPMDLPKSKRSTAFLLLKALPYEEAQRIKTFPYFRRSKNCNRTGLTLERVLLRRYPYGDMARLSIGRVGETKEDRTVRGRSGLEHALDSLLFGKQGIARKMLFTRGEGMWATTPAQNGITVRTTIDITIQDILERELGEMLVNTEARWGSAMIMEVATGDIKAISNLDRDTINPENGYIEAKNHIVEAYEPGSVIKVISMLSALEDGYVNLNQVYPIGRSYVYNKSVIRDTHSPGSLAVSQFIEYSSNIGMTKLVAPHYENNLNGLRERLRELGFFDPLKTGMALETPPYYPTLDHAHGGKTSLSRFIFGYGMKVPPLYICAVYNAIANGGKYVRPRLVSAMRFPDGRDSIIPVSYVRDSICSQKNAAILREMMHSVVWGEGGTARFLKDKNVEIAGKTGTAKLTTEPPRDRYGRRLHPEIPFRSRYIDGHYRVTFCGFYPYENPKYTCVVVICDPNNHSAARTSGQVLRNVALKLYSRGYLNDGLSLENSNASEQRPTFYGSYNSDRYTGLRSSLGIEHSAVLRTDNSGEAGAVPNVTGLGIREALVELERRGLNVKFIGSGYVTGIDPPIGTYVTPGTVVTVTLSQQ